MKKPVNKFLTFIVFAIVCFIEFPRIYGNFIHRWALTEIESKEVSHEGSGIFIVRLPDSAADIKTSLRTFNSIQEKDRICVEYRHNSTTKEVEVFSYSVIETDCLKRNHVWPR